jgi:hypothetical protein
LVFLTWKCEFSEQSVLECKKSKIIHELPLYEERIGVWCAINAHRITGPIFHDDTINAARYVNNILSPFFFPR